MRTLLLASLVSLGACRALDVPPAETPYYREQLALARSAPPARTAPEAETLRESSSKLEVRAAAETERIRRGDETEGLLDVDAPEARDFLAKLAAPDTAEPALSSAPLDLERVLLAVYARNPDVASARANWAATVRMYEQATYLEDLLLRYSAFTRLATPPVGAAPMREAAFPYPGLVALKGEMIDREVTMAREMTRMRLRDAMAAAARACHDVAHYEQELDVRTEQLALADRMVAAARARVATGTSPQAELLQMEAERAMADNDRTGADAALARARGELNTLLARPYDATIAVERHGDPPDETPPVGLFVALAARYSPEARMARAESGRTAAAIRMGEAMLFAAPAPGAVAAGAPMGGTMPIRPDGGGMAGPQVLPARDAPPSGAPGAFGPDVAWVAELRERKVALDRAAEEAARAAEREVVVARYELDAARRMFQVAAKSTEPLAAQAAEERLRLYEAGRGDFAALVDALRQRLDAAHAAVVARHEYGLAQAMLWRAAGARPEAVKSGGEERSER